MPYTPTNWVNGVTPGSQPNMNNLETQYAEASKSFQADLVTAFVFTGFNASRDGSILNQLNVLAGTAYLTQSDSTKRNRSLLGSTPGQFTTATPSTTYYLFLKNDGTFQWSTTST